jgi:signal transduction histidine kinase
MCGYLEGFYMACRPLHVTSQKRNRHQIHSESTKDKPKGTGLGLPICKEVIGHYGGDIWVGSEEG